MKSDRAKEIPGISNRNQIKTTLAKCFDNSGYVETTQKIKPKRSTPTQNIYRPHKGINYYKKESTHKQK